MPMTHFIDWNNFLMLLTSSSPKNKDSLRGTFHHKTVIKPSSNLFRLVKLIIHHIETNLAMKTEHCNYQKSITLL